MEYHGFHSAKACPDVDSASRHSSPARSQRRTPGEILRPTVRLPRGEKGQITFSAFNLLHQLEDNKESQSGSKSRLAL